VKAYWDAVVQIAAVVAVLGVCLVVAGLAVAVVLLGLRRLGGGPIHLREPRPAGSGPARERRIRLASRRAFGSVGARAGQSDALPPPDSMGRTPRTARTGPARVGSAGARAGQSDPLPPPDSMGRTPRTARIGSGGPARIGSADAARTGSAGSRR
jgi:hypothetical protein